VGVWAWYPTMPWLQCEVNVQCCCSASTEFWRDVTCRGGSVWVYDERTVVVYAADKWHQDVFVRLQLHCKTCSLDLCCL
jgi:hypothetical protein